MSANSYTDELERRGLLSERRLAKLRERLTNSERPLSARSVANLLVQKNYLSQQQATDALNALTVLGVNVDSTEAADTAAPPVVGNVPASEAVDEPEGSSIFAPFLVAKSSTSRPPAAPRPPAEEEELTLADTGEEDFVPPEELGRPVKGISLSPQAIEQRTFVEEEPLWTAGGDEPAGVGQEPASAKSFTPSPFDAPVTKQQADDVERLDTSSKKKKKKPVKRKNEFDSPLILIGGGVLVLLILCIGAVLLLLRGRSGEEQLQLADQAAQSGAYGQAIELYQDFLDRFARHPSRSAAHVKLGITRLRRDVEGGDLDRALATAQKELVEIEEEEKFVETAQEELAALLPRIAQGLASRAEAAPGPEEAGKSIEQAHVALALCSNARYIPNSLRNEAQLNDVRATLARVERRRQSHQDLQSTLDVMATAVEKGDPHAAYDVYRKLVVQRPELADDAALTAMLTKATEAERTAIQFVAEDQPAETSEPPLPFVAALAVAQRRTAGAAGAAGEPVCVRVEGAIYGLDAAAGRLLWQRHVGSDSLAGFSSAPLSVSGDVIFLDGAGQLVRWNATTGDLRWRQRIGEACAAPLLLGDRAILAGESGRLYVVDVNSGARKGFVKFAQPLRVTPAADRQGRRLYLTGDRASLYCLSLADMNCLGVHHVGHAKGSICVSPAATQDKLAVLENDGLETCRLRLFSFDERGAIAKQTIERRFNGLASSPPLVAGRRLIIVTDRGLMEVFDVGSGADENVLSLVATREVTDSRPLVRFVAVADGHIWMGDNQLTKHAIQPTGNRLPVISIDNDYRGATFDHPLVVVGKTLVYVHRPKGRAGFVAAGMDMQAGRVLWEIGLAIPPAAAPFIDSANQSLLTVNANGAVYRIDAAALRAGVVDQPLAAPPMPAQARPLTAGVSVSEGRAAYSAAESDRVLLVDASQGIRAAQWITLPGPLACPVSRFGDGLLAPLALGQVLYLNPADGRELGAPFQPTLEPRTTLRYSQPATIDGTQKSFVICDGRDKLYLVSLAMQPRPHLETVAEAAIGADPIVSPIAVVGETALAVTKNSRLVRFSLPSLSPAGEIQLSAPVVWGPHPVSGGLLLATADGQMMFVSADGNVAWRQPTEHGDIIGPPLVAGGHVCVAYARGTLQRQDLADGKSLGKVDLARSLGAGPVLFSNRILLTARDGTLLVVNQP
jgi:outer membrane protein assembly factor BamB